MKRKRSFIILATLIIAVTIVATLVFLPNQKKESGEATSTDTQTPQEDQNIPTESTDDSYDKISAAKNAAVAFLNQNADEPMDIRALRLQEFFISNSSVYKQLPNNINTAATPAIYKSSCDTVLASELIIGDTSDNGVSIKCSVSFTNNGSDKANSVKYETQFWIVSLAKQNDTWLAQDIQPW